jgi:threonine/homoserine/homoserine lactone efflux protein
MMTLDVLAALAVFAFVTSITPGPNNLMLLASGANFGFRRTIPHMLGVTLGFIVMVMIVGAGLARALDGYPTGQIVLKVLSVGYLLYLAWKFATAAPPRPAEDAGTPMTFVQAAAFQWVNPKALAMALAAVTIYAPSQSLAAIASVAMVFGAINFPSICVWTGLGQRLQRMLTSSTRLRTFNITMAVVLIASLLPVIIR